VQQAGALSWRLGWLVILDAVAFLNNRVFEKDAARQYTIGCGESTSKVHSRWHSR